MSGPLWWWDYYGVEYLDPLAPPMRQGSERTPEMDRVRPAGSVVEDPEEPEFVVEVNPCQ